MPDLIGTTLGHYRIVEQIGAGGMGVVYRARDERLDRDVAIKVLPEEVAADPERLARFEREAKLLASLNHPNIATLHGLEEIETSRFLVMELVAGESLASVIARGAILVDEALPIALQITQALEAAHENGIIHRDLKPANVMVDAEGGVKVLDFGLAKAFDPNSSSPQSPESIAESPTLTAEMTRAGTLLGTAAYMSPEQARGKLVDKRADIWAFGCVLYEMLAGRRVFGGECSTDVLAQVIEREPDWDELPRNTAPAVQTVLRRCLRKDPYRRLHDIADVRIAIDEVGETEERILSTEAASRWTAKVLSIAVVVAALFGVIAGSLGIRWLNRSAPAFPVAVQIEAPEMLLYDVDFDVLAVSADGRHLAYVATDDLHRRLVHRSLEDFAASVIPDSEGARSPFFSPDSQWIGFSCGNSLKKVSVQGGAPIVLSQNCGGGATWSPNGKEIIVSQQGSLWRVPAAGGQAQLILEPGPGHAGYTRPEFLPDGQAVLVETSTHSRSWSSNSIVVLDLESLETIPVIRPGTDPAYSPSGHIVFARGSDIFALGFDSQERTVSSEPFPVLENVWETEGAAQFSISRDGLLAFIEAPEIALEFGNRSLVWADREGRTTSLCARRDFFEEPRLSPDDSKVAVGINGELWIFDIPTETWQQLFSSDGWAHMPVWNPSGDRIVFGQGMPNIWHYLPYTIASDFSGSAKQILEHDFDANPCSFSPSGQLVLVERDSAGLNVLTIPKDRGLPRHLVQSDAFEHSPMVSPNGRWLAYVSDRSGMEEVYVEAFPEGGPRIQVSNDGGSEPLWAPDGGEIFYKNGAQLIAVPVTTTPDFAITGERQVLFTGEGFGFVTRTPRTRYDVARDGRRFLMVQMGPEETRQRVSRQRIRLIFNWFEELKRLVPAER